MVALSNAQLLMLNNLIYTDYCDNGNSVGKIVQEISNDLDHGKTIEGCEMTQGEWRELISAIEAEPSLLSYTVQNYENNTVTGMRAACFVNNVENPSDVNVVFRGTATSYEWHDNGEGGYLSDTEQQKAAADYINGLPETYGDGMTVTGHSKGGNKAQYVTIVTDRIGKCVSFDGQGFSEEFLEKYKEQIAKKSQDIVSISASNDYVNCLLYSIAGTKIFIETPVQENPLYYHKPNILLDEEGNLRRKTQPSNFSVFLNEYTTYMISNLDEPERSLTIDGLLALMEKGEDKEDLWQTIYAGESAVSHLDDFAFDLISRQYGLPTELAVSYLAAVAFPYLFLDDLLHCGKEMTGMVIGGMMNFAKELERKLRSFGEKAGEYAKKFVDAVTTYINKIKEWYHRNGNRGLQYAAAHTYIRVDTNMLRSYSDRLSRVNQRITNLDRRMDRLYTKVALQDLLDLLQADLLMGYRWRLSRCMEYLNETANEFDGVERSISSQ